jgi:Zn-dependent protease with chaperone function
MMNIIINSSLSRSEQQRCDRYIKAALDKLPRPVVKKILEDCIFFVASAHDLGACIKGKKVIFINWYALKRIGATRDEILSVIGHELCHAALNSNDERKVCAMADRFFPQSEKPKSC